MPICKELVPAFEVQRTLALSRPSPVYRLFERRKQHRQKRQILVNSSLLYILKTKGRLHQGGINLMRGLSVFILLH